MGKIPAVKPQTFAVVRENFVDFGLQWYSLYRFLVVWKLIILLKWLGPRVGGFDGRKYFAIREEVRFGAACKSPW